MRPSATTREAVGEDLRPLALRAGRRAGLRGRRRTPARTAAKRVDGRLQRLDPLCRVGGPFHSRDREREDRRHDRDADGDAKPVLAQEGDVRVVVLGQLELPQADRVEPGSRICLDVLVERWRRPSRSRRARGSRASGKLSRAAAGRSAASSAPSRRGSRSRPRAPGPGWVLAPMCQRPATAVSWPGAPGKRAPEEVLVERARAAVDVAADEVAC